MNLVAREVKLTNIDSVVDFCLEYESTCINLVNYLLEKKEELSTKNNGSLQYSYVYYLNDEVIGASCKNSHGFFVYCLPTPKEQIYSLIAKLYDFSNIFALMGERDVQNSLLYHLKTKHSITPKWVIPYFLMRNMPSLQGNKHEVHFCETVNKELTIRKATLKDATKLLPLQIAYEQEEVLKEGERVNKKIALMNLEKTLHHQTVYLAEIYGNVVAKANTNVKGVKCQQIGGVYTSPRYRRRGIGYATVSCLTKDIHNAKREATLFVKTNNTTAINLYNKLGFKRQTNFQISYLK